MAPLHFRCLNNHEWDMKFEMTGIEVPLCPTCNTQAIIESPTLHADWGAGRRGRQCQGRGN